MYVEKYLNLNATMEMEILYCSHVRTSSEPTDPKPDGNSPPPEGKNEASSVGDEMTTAIKIFLVVFAGQGLAATNR